MKQLNDSEKRIVNRVLEETTMQMNTYQSKIQQQVSNQLVDVERKFAESISNKTSQMKTSLDMRFRKLEDRISKIEQYLGIASPLNQSELRLGNSSVSVQQQQEEQEQQISLADQINKIKEDVDNQCLQFLQEIKQNLVYQSDLKETQQKIIRLEEELTQIKKNDGKQQIATEFTQYVDQYIENRHKWFEEQITNLQQWANQVNNYFQQSQVQNQAKLNNVQNHTNFDKNQNQGSTLNIQHQPSQSLQKKFQTAQPNQNHSQSQVIQNNEQQQNLPFLQTQYG